MGELYGTAPLFYINTYIKTLLESEFLIRNGIKTLCENLKEVKNEIL